MGKRHDSLLPLSVMLVLLFIVPQCCNCVPRSCLQDLIWIQFSWKRLVPISFYKCSNISILFCAFHLTTIVWEVRIFSMECIIVLWVFLMHDIWPLFFWLGQLNPICISQSQTVTDQVSWPWVYFAHDLRCEFAKFAKVTRCLLILCCIC